MAQDDEIVDLTRDAPVREYRPPITEFGTTEEILAGIHDLLGMLNTNFIVANSGKKKGKPKAPKPFPRPETARDRAKKRWGARDVLDIVTAVTPAHANRVKRALRVSDEDE